MATGWLLRRPFIQAMKTGCPPPPPGGNLEPARVDERFAGKAVLARPAALQAYRRMVAQARRQLSLPPQILTIASAFRPPAEEAARCADGGCGTAAKARCSAHRTGLAMDLYLGSEPGREPFSSDQNERAYESATAAYRWMVVHAGDFGFVPYPFEPWHWEWTGESV
jgi:LAS superfamily LD-carboxypeptidase LdcB